MVLVATTFAVTSFAEEPKRPDKAEAIQAIEQSIGGKFVQESPSKDNPAVQWKIFGRGLPWFSSDCRCCRLFVA